MRPELEHAVPLTPLPTGVPYGAGSLRLLSAQTPVTSGEAQKASPGKLRQRMLQNKRLALGTSTASASARHCRGPGCSGSSAPCLPNCRRYIDPRACLGLVLLCHQPQSNRAHQHGRDTMSACLVFVSGDSQSAHPPQSPAAAQESWPCVPGVLQVDDVRRIPRQALLKHGWTAVVAGRPLD